MTTSLFGLPVAHTSAWIFNCYVIYDDDGVVMFDPGLPVVARQALDLVTTHLDRSVADVRGVVCSHAHHDHVGGVSTITAAADVDVHLPHRCRAYLDGERPRVFPPVESLVRFISVLSEQPFSRHAATEFVKLGLAGRLRRTTGHQPRLHADQFLDHRRHRDCSEWLGSRRCSRPH